MPPFGASSRAAASRVGFWAAEWSTYSRRDPQHYITASVPRPSRLHLTSSTTIPVPAYLQSITCTEPTYQAAAMSATEAAAKTFFSYPAFAVVGASSNPAKYGNKGTFPSHS